MSVKMAVVPPIPSASVRTAVAVKTRATQNCPLPGDVRGAGTAAAQEPLRQRGVEAPCHGVLDERAILREEGAHLEGLRRAVGARAGDSDVDVDEAGLERQDGV